MGANIAGIPGVIKAISKKTPAESAELARQRTIGTREAQRVKRQTRRTRPTLLGDLRGLQETFGR